MLIEKEVIRPGTYWYRDQTTGAPRKLVVTPELTKYWAEQGNAMLSSGLTVPVPCEHDFNAHPMTPASKLKSNAGWVTGYTLKGDRLHASLDVQDAEVAKKLPTTIRWTSPWINSFTDGKGKTWSNVIAHLALTTRPRVVDQEPFGSVAAALSAAEVLTDWSMAGSRGFCLTRAGRLEGDAPVYPVAFSLYSGAPLDASLAWSDASRKAALEARKRNAAGRKATRGAEAEAHSKMASQHTAAAGAIVHDAGGHHAKAHMSSLEAEHHLKSGNKKKAAAAHRSASKSHRKAAEEHMKAGRHEEATKHLNAANSHQMAAEVHGTRRRKKTAPDEDAIHLGIDDKGKPNREEPDEDDFGGEDDYDEDDDDEDMEDEEVDEPDQPGDVTMEELLCDLLGALGVHLEHSGDPAQFKRELYNAVMTKIHDLAGKGQQPQQQGPNRANPPGQPPNNPRPGGGGQKPNPIMQTEQQPMYMSLEDINKLDEPLKSVALAMHNETVAARSKATEAERVLNSLRDAKLKEAAAARAKRVALLTKLSPRAKSDLEAMLASPAMALSLGDGGEVVDPMAATLQVLEKGLVDMPRLLTSESAALNVQPQPSDETILTEARANEIADAFARQMGCAPVAAS